MKRKRPTRLHPDSKNAQVEAIVQRFERAVTQFVSLLNFLNNPKETAHERAHQER